MTCPSGSLVASERSELQQVSVSAALGQKLEPWTGPTSVQDPDGPVPCCSAVIRVTAKQPTNSVRLAICVQPPLAVSQKVFMLRTVSECDSLLEKFDTEYTVLTFTIFDSLFE